MIPGHGLRQGSVDLAALDTFRTSGSERASLRSVAHAHRNPRNPSDARRPTVIGNRYHQSPRVGVLGLTENGSGWSNFNDATGIHDRDLIGDRPHGGEVMGDVDHRDA